MTELARPSRRAAAAKLPASPIAKKPCLWSSFGALWPDISALSNVSIDIMPVFRMTLVVHLARMTSKGRTANDRTEWEDRIGCTAHARQLRIDADRPSAVSIR